MMTVGATISARKTSCLKTKTNFKISIQSEENHKHIEEKMKCVAEVFKSSIFCHWSLVSISKKRFTASLKNLFITPDFSSASEFLIEQISMRQSCVRHQQFHESQDIWFTATPSRIQSCAPTFDVNGCYSGCLECLVSLTQVKFSTPSRVYRLCFGGGLNAPICQRSRKMSKVKSSFRH